MAEKSNAVRKIYSVCFFVLMVVLGFAAVFGFFQKKISANTQDEVHEENEFSAVSFSAQYPFEENESAESANEKTGSEFFRSYQYIIQQKTIGANKYLTEFNPLSLPFKNIQNFFSDFSYSGLVINGNETFVKLPNGYLAGCFEYCPSQKSCNNIKDFSNWLKVMDIPYVTMITPDKSDDSVTEFPKGIPHGYTQMLDEYKAFMDNNGINYIESKQTLLAENNNFYSWFYKSDPHWNVHAAYSMARKTAEYLNDEFSIATDAAALDDDNFKLTVYENSFLGGYGGKLGNSWKEDMEILYPVTSTDFHVEIPGYSIDKTGSFENTLIDQSRLKPGNTSYRAFLYGDYPLVHIENNNCQNGTKILVIKFSYADPLCPYLACTSQYVDMLDPRHFDGSIRSYVQQTKPDCVILCTGVVTEYNEYSLGLK